MYYQNQHQGKNILSSSRMNITSENRPFLKGGINTSSGDSGLILSTDAKPRLKWTSDLHERFIEAVNQLGGADKATPKTIMKVMGIPGLTLYHLKSHLQKYRLGKNLNGQANNGLNKIGMMTMIEEKNIDVDEIQSESLSIGQQPNNDSPISEALQMQIEVQRRLHEQLEVQRHLQLRIEAQGKYLQSVLEKAQETLGRQNIGVTEIEDAQVQISELVSKVSTEYPNSSFLEHKEPTQQMQTTYPKMLENNMLGLRTNFDDSISEKKESVKEPLFQRMELTWREGFKGNNHYLSTMVSDNEYRDERFKEKGEEENHVKVETQSTKTEIDLNNTHVENYCTTSTKQFDLNGFSWN